MRHERLLFFEVVLGEVAGAAMREERAWLGRLISKLV